MAELHYVATPEPQSDEIEVLVQYLFEEIRNLQEILTGQYTQLKLDELHVEPERPRNNIIVLADGTDWNPGAGAGFYGRQSDTWVKLG